jgi:outer membrane protein
MAGAAQNLATVSFNTVVLQTAEAQKGLGALQTRFAPREDHLKALNSEVEALRKQLAANSNLNDAERTTEERSLESKERQLQREADDFKSDSQSESEQIFQRVAQKVYAFLQTYSEQHGYTFVIERGSDTNPVVWYAAAKTDITDEVIKAYNAQTGGDAPKSGKALPEAPSHN